ncbi:unnamed protein product [Onchocerca flexuosa]|uniref:SAM domain-containing protein n=1 Tax=Onchocerca flexuosa TaxID=387005 RepID=A0A183HDK6_9BILA|nr:unnamed protein product [Onchocerca flexuosa]
MEVNSLTELLSQLKLEKYIELFEIENIDLNLFLELNDDDLIEIGIKAYGPRKKMLNVIQRYRTDGTLICKNDSKVISYPYNKERKQLKLHSEQVINELMESQQRLVECQQELRQAQSLKMKYRPMLKSISEVCPQAQKIAYIILQEVRQANGKGSSLEKDVFAIIKNIDKIQKKMVELSQ